MTTKKSQPISTVNFHLLEPCNMGCAHCFAANLHSTLLPLEDATKLVRTLAHAGFRKINFAGGEPMLYPGLDVLIREAKGSGTTTSIVTNGTRITDGWLDGISGHLDWIALSIDSSNPETHGRSGRATVRGPLPTERYLEICSSIRGHGIRLKINTVVTRFNCNEDMTEFIREAKPERWKIMQALPVRGQNDHNAGLFEVTGEQFAAYVERNRDVNGVVVVPESNDLMTGSYVMVDPMGRFFDNTRGVHTYSRPILLLGVTEALSDVSIDPERFERRGGRYE